MFIKFNILIFTMWKYFFCVTKKNFYMMQQYFSYVDTKNLSNMMKKFLQHAKIFVRDVRHVRKSLIFVPSVKFNITDALHRSCKSCQFLLEISFVLTAVSHSLNLLLLIVWTKKVLFAIILIVVWHTELLLQSRKVAQLANFVQRIEIAIKTVQFEKMCCNIREFRRCWIGPNVWLAIAQLCIRYGKKIFNYPGWSCSKN